MNKTQMGKRCKGRKAGHSMPRDKGRRNSLGRQNLISRKEKKHAEIESCSETLKHGLNV